MICDLKATPHLILREGTFCSQYIATSLYSTGILKVFITENIFSPLPPSPVAGPHTDCAIKQILMESFK
jgi:hypothetical protein